MVYYQTVEKRESRLSSPIFSKRKNAWLGKGYYFWSQIEDAHIWGKGSQNKNGFYEIYISEIDETNILDTVFNKEHYEYWVEQIESFAKIFFEQTGYQPSVKDVCQYFNKSGIWSNVDGVKFQDLPQNNKHLMVQNFYYRKRIQLAVYNKKIILSFIFHLEGGQNGS
jgi:hypothetical protein